MIKSEYMLHQNKKNNENIEYLSGSIPFHDNAFYDESDDDDQTDSVE